MMSSLLDKENNQSIFFKSRTISRFGAEDKNGLHINDEYSWIFINVAKRKYLVLCAVAVITGNRGDQLYHTEPADWT